MGAAGFGIYTTLLLAVVGFATGRSSLVRSLVLLLAVLSLTSPSVGSGEVIYGPGDWVRYRYVIETANETCAWVLRITIEWVNATHVKYGGGLEAVESGSALCQSLTQLLILGLSIESATPTEFNTTTPLSRPRRTIVNPAYTGTYTYDNATATYYRGILVSYSERATVPVVGLVKVYAVDTSIEELRKVIAAAHATPTSPASPTAQPTAPGPATLATTATTPTETAPLATDRAAPTPTATQTPQPSGVDVAIYIAIGAVAGVVATLVLLQAAKRRS